MFVLSVIVIHCTGCVKSRIVPGFLDFQRSFHNECGCNDLQWYDIHDRSVTWHGLRRHLKTHSGEKSKIQGWINDLQWFLTDPWHDMVVPASNSRQGGSRGSATLGKLVGASQWAPTSAHKLPQALPWESSRKHSSRSSGAAGRESSGINQVSLQSSTVIESIHWRTLHKRVESC